MPSKSTKIAAEYIVLHSINHIKMTIPLIVYLDTQDYSKLYSDNSQQIQDVLRYLRDRVDSGDILIPNSYFIIAELLTSFTGEFRDDRLQRVAILKRLCGSNAFRFIDAEMSPENALSKDGYWYPKFDPWEYLKNGMSEQVTMLLNALPSRVTAKIDRRNPWPTLFKFVPQLEASISQGAKSLPVPKSFSESHLLVRYLKGEISEVVMRAETETMLTDLDVFFSFWFENEMNKNVSILHELIRTAGNPYLKLANDFISVSQKARDHLDLVNKLSRELGSASKNFKEEIRSAKNTLGDFQRLDIDFVKSFIPDKSMLDKLPKHFGDTILKYAIGVMKEGRKVHESDTGDLMHACYLPYCDIWRGDVKFSNLLIGQQVEGYQKIVRTLPELPAAIENRLRENSV